MSRGTSLAAPPLHKRRPRSETTGGLLAGTDAASCIIVGRVLIASFQRFAINRFANINMHAYYSTVRGRPSQ